MFLDAYLRGKTDGRMTSTATMLSKKPETTASRVFILVSTMEDPGGRGEKNAWWEGSSGHKQHDHDLVQGAFVLQSCDSPRILMASTQGSSINSPAKTRTREKVWEIGGRDQDEEPSYWVHK
jgi:hypothetical protein